MLYDCWKIWVMMGAICFAVSLRTLAGSSSGPVALDGLDFPAALLRHLCQFREGGVGISRGGYLGDGVLFLGKYRAILVV